MRSMQTLTKQPLMDPDAPNRSTAIVGGASSGLLNWNDIAHPHMYELYQALLANFWKAQEINMQDDIKNWDSLSDTEKDVFLRINTQLASLDSLQTPTMTQVMDYVSDSSFKSIFAVIAQQEAVHTESYSYVLSSLVPLDEQNRRFDEAKNDPLVRKRNARILSAYEAFRTEPNLENLLKLAVNSINLEGIYFYAGFAFFYHLARQQKMLKTSTMISYIQRDEMQHAYFVSQFIRILIAENPELATDEMNDWIRDEVAHAVELEKEWAQHILGDIDGLDLDEFNEYVEYLANKRLRQIGLGNLYETRDNPMPWIRVFGDEMMNSTKSDFFEQKSRAYTKVSESNGFDEL
ncbi:MULTISPECIES: ribonucleotide-diphosphate reductase subunit beta [unclassified Planococcus (in: firmicutes)]|uniref:ribonucleotide-diphosphate reductase subunit beta n=1 Tax=unclassified Planococcus (in: firmicutes) TaxID=2662419 RepID=UPI000C3319A2|nr:MULTISPECIES: ribonucleotide-diphosphate reductase subunit beta [unclassified Planococcus (in: firmicutes)]AUD15121.1 ribonucleotide-diphosphate reductase subunit beta [Planococcus sp. MB-3u-03]PKG46254.1 ribonucleotide-diphosphate reductase subunit beta [Planococcus sp. Urea-trap-24]PKG90040.1 ribonucleotide-diphosphate reductase subunit beta [Planococcus sp. Urea-3u-39]PKH35752.1 ribonucleotide-diphosphate reductase subunit beta [Planococcus sp. MB-3u-09]